MKICVGDLEGNGLLPTITKLWCGVFKDIQTGEVFKFRPEQIETEMLPFLDTVDVLIMHNGIGFDWPVLEKLYKYKFKGQKVDTLIMSRLLDPKRLVPFNCPNKKIGPHSVEAWGYRVGRGKVEHEDWSQFSEEMLHRCSEDVEVQHLIFKALEKEYSGKNWKNAFKLSFKLFEYLQKQEQYGWLVDQEHMHFCIHQLQHWIDRIDRALDKHLPLIVEVLETKDKGEYKYIKKPFLKSGDYSESVKNWYAAHSLDAANVGVGGPFTRITFRKVDLNSNDETKDYLLRAGWEPLEWNYNEAGERSSPKLSKDDPFDGVIGGVGRLVARRVQCRQRKSIVEGLLRIVRDDGRIASVINSLAVTGRATHRNIVNMPGAKSFFGKQMRKIFICKPGYVLVGTDSDACQIRMLCGRMKDPVYTDNVLNGKKEDGTDIHSVNMRAAGLGNRDDAKTFFYGFLFGAGDAKVGKIVKGTAADGQRLKVQFLAGLPALGDLMQRITAEWRLTAKRRFNAKWNKMEYYDGYITGLDGRPIKVPFEHQILVYLLQSDESIMMSAAYIRFHQLMEKTGLRYGEDYGTVIWMHDEFNVEVKEEYAEIVARNAEESIAWAGRFYKIPCPHLGQAKIGRNWYDIH
jgi:DNA polymerase-1